MSVPMAAAGTAPDGNGPCWAPDHCGASAAPRKSPSLIWNIRLVGFRCIQDALQIIIIYAATGRPHRVECTLFCMKDRSRSRPIHLTLSSNSSPLPRGDPAYRRGRGDLRLLPGSRGEDIVSAMHTLPLHRRSGFLRGAGDRLYPTVPRRTRISRWRPPVLNRCTVERRLAVRDASPCARYAALSADRRRACITLGWRVRAGV